LGLERLSTGTAGLDRLLRGGFPVGKISLVYGEASTGKTVLMMQSALEASARGMKVFFVDSDLSFSVQRLGSLDRDGKFAENILVFQPEEFRDQVRITESLEAMMSRTPVLLIVDSITGLYRADLGKPGTAFASNRELNRQLAYLADLASRFDLIVLLTGQVHSHPSRGTWLIAPVATRTLRHWSSVILRLRATPRFDVKECVLEKIDGRDTRGPQTLFRIGENGLEGV
jgi:RecA/RadA recombinase